MLVFFIICRIQHCQAQVQLASSVQIQLKNEISLIIKSLYQYLMPDYAKCTIMPDYNPDNGTNQLLAKFRQIQKKITFIAKQAQNLCIAE